MGNLCDTEIPCDATLALKEKHLKLHDTVEYCKDSKVEKTNVNKDGTMSINAVPPSLEGSLLGCADISRSSSDDLFFSFKMNHMGAESSREHIARKVGERVTEDLKPDLVLGMWR